MTGRPVQTWARRAGWACLLLPLPSVTWRLLMLAGVDVGFAETHLFRGSVAASLYVVGLDVVEVLVGLACLGLIRPWGERVPRWVPGVGGRTIPRLVPVTIAAAGNAMLYVIYARLLLQFVPVWLGRSDAWVPDHGMTGTQRALLLACYVPFLLWPLPITAAIVGYWRRRSPGAVRREAVTTRPAAAV